MNSKHLRVTIRRKGQKPRSGANLMLSRFLVLYGAPETVSLPQFFREYAQSVHGTDEEVLKRATRRVIETHTYQGWPRIAWVLKAIHAVAEEVAAARPIEEADPYAHIAPPTPEQKAAVNALVADAIAQIKRPR